MAPKVIGCAAAILTAEVSKKQLIYKLYPHNLKSAKMSQ